MQKKIPLECIAHTSVSNLPPSSAVGAVVRWFWSPGRPKWPPHLPGHGHPRVWWKFAGPTRSPNPGDRLKGAQQPQDQRFQWRNRATSEEIDEPNPSKGSQFAKPTTTTGVYWCGCHKKNQNRPPISLDFIRWDLPSGWTWLRTVALGLWRYSDLRLFIWHVTSNEHPRQTVSR